MKTNPFEVLRLDPASSEEEVVRQAGRLRQRAADEATLDALRQAVQALTGSQRDRLLHALLTHPRPEHQTPQLDRLAATYRRPPTPAGTALVPRPEWGEWAQMLGACLAEGIELPQLPFEALPDEESAGEIRRQTAEALWQDLLIDSGA